MNTVDMMNFLSGMDKALSNGDFCTAYTFGKRMMDEISEVLESAEKQIKEMDEGEWKNDEARRLLVLKLMNKNTIDLACVDELTESELRRLVKPSETSLKSVGRTDLIEKYKKSELVKTIRVTRYKD